MSRAPLYVMPLPRPYTDAVIHYGCRLVHYRRKNVPKGERSRHGPQGDFLSARPPPEAVGAWCALVASPDYDEPLRGWVEKRLSIQLPRPEETRPNVVVGFARLARVTTIAHGPRDTWWMTGDIGVAAGCWLEDVRECEPLDFPSPPVMQPVTDPEWLVDLRARFSMAPLWSAERRDPEGR